MRADADNSEFERELREAPRDGAGMMNRAAAKDWAHRVIYETSLGLRWPSESNAASVLLTLLADRDDQDRALHDAIRATAAAADELAFWKYQAIWQRAVRLQHDVITAPYIEDTKAWKEAERQLEDARTAENRERVSHAEAPRDPTAS